MSLKKCKECGREISTSADACPHCGNLSPAKKAVKVGTDIIKAGLGLTVLIPIVFIIVIVLLATFGEQP